ncbi:MAG: histidinol phosphate phosphatase [Sulfurimonas sp.]|nr:MAG: histidinol phosphate phosphatase [Sulfurimonas sp.]
MIVDLHNHTTLCNHAEGSMSQYIDNAIKCGVKYFGFSEHAPMYFDSKYRMSFDEMPLYIKKVLELKQLYKNDINILLGLEVDYIKNHMDDRVLNAKVDYLIGSVHFIDEWGFDNPEFIGNYENEDINVIWQKYFNTIENMAKSKLFDIVGHFDLIKIFKFMPTIYIKDLAKNALLAIKEADMTLELNVAGYRKPVKEAYPSKELLELAYEMDIPICFASDAHAPEQVGLFNEKITKLARSVGYTKCAYYKNRKRKLIEF